MNIHASGVHRTNLRVNPRASLAVRRTSQNPRRRSDIPSQGSVEETEIQEEALEQEGDEDEKLDPAFTVHPSKPVCTCCIKLSSKQSILENRGTFLWYRYRYST